VLLGDAEVGSGYVISIHGIVFGLIASFIVDIHVV